MSPSGKRVAVANFSDNRWSGEIEHLQTDIVLMNVDRNTQGGKPLDDRARCIVEFLHFWFLFKTFFFQKDLCQNFCYK